MNSEWAREGEAERVLSRRECDRLVADVAAPVTDAALLCSHTPLLLVGHSAADNGKRHALLHKPERDSCDCICFRSKSTTKTCVHCDHNHAATKKTPHLSPLSAITANPNTAPTTQPATLASLSIRRTPTPSRTGHTRSVRPSDAEAKPARRADNGAHTRIATQPTRKNRTSKGKSESYRLLWRASAATNRYD